MGKKSGSGGRDAAAKASFVLKVAMHCECKGCIDKVRAAVRDLTLLQAVEAAVDAGGGEVRVLADAAADPERLRRRLRKATGKKVDLLFPTTSKAAGGSGDKMKEKEKEQQEAAHFAALLAGLQQQQAQAQAQARYYGQGQAQGGAWAASQQQMLAGLGLSSCGGGAWDSGAGSYGTAAPASSYPCSSPAAYYPSAAPPAASWGGAYAAYPPPSAPAYYGGGGAPAPWHGNGY